jgi:hypothetical protein
MSEVPSFSSFPDLVAQVNVKRGHGRLDGDRDVRDRKRAAKRVGADDGHRDVGKGRERGLDKVDLYRISGTVLNKGKGKEVPILVGDDCC